jgi:hypothetical protein
MSRFNVQCTGKIEDDLYQINEKGGVEYQVDRFGSKVVDPSTIVEQEKFGLDFQQYLDAISKKDSVLSVDLKKYCLGKSDPQIMATLN